MKPPHESDEQAGAPGALPSAAELGLLYHEYRLRYFALATLPSQLAQGLAADGYAVPALTQVRIEWSGRLTSSAGICYPKRRIIRLSPHYHVRFPAEIGPTLLHEMIHLIVPGHGPAFHRWLEYIRVQGGTVHRYAQERAAPARWVYVCRRCERRYPRQRRLKGHGRHHCCRTCGRSAGSLVERKEPRTYS